MLKLMLRKISMFASSNSSKITKSDPIMLFASYPVGFPMLKKLHQEFENISVVTHYSKPSNKFKNEV